jgi:hypothetical protein
MDKFRKYLKMPIITPSMTGHGPLIRVGIYDTDNKLHTFYALLDTGASHTCIDSQLLKDLNNNPIKIGSNQCATGDACPAPFHNVNLHVENENNIYMLALNVNVVSLDISSIKPLPPAHKVLIGRDVLSRCTFIYDGKNNIYSLEW